MKGSANIFTYKMSSKLIEVLKRPVVGLYGWVHPKMPEDLSFSKRGEVWFYSTAHERESCFRLTDSEHNALFTAFPSLNDLIG
jgi:hypothetical protein